MGLLNIIRRLALRDKLSIREISRRTGLSRNTVTKHPNSGTIEPRFATPERPSKLDPFADKLAAWLRAEATKSRKQKRTLEQLHSDLVALGFTGSYGRVAAFARRLTADDPRILRTVRKVIRGLSYHHGVHEPVEDGRVFADVMRMPLPEEIVATMAYNSAEPDILEYGYTPIDEPKGLVSAWLLRFYQRTSFTGFVFKDEAARTEYLIR